MTTTGPVQVLAIGFRPDARFEGQIFNEMARLEGNGMVRVLDLLFLGFDPTTDELLVLDWQGSSLGSLVGALLGFVFDGDDVRRRTVLEPPGGDGLGLSRSELEDLLRGGQADDAVAVMLVEHLWARDLKEAIASAGGVPLGEGFLSEELLAAVEADLGETVRRLDAQALSRDDATAVT